MIIQKNLLSLKSCMYSQRLNNRSDESNEFLTYLYLHMTYPVFFCSIRTCMSLVRRTYINIQQYDISGNLSAFYVSAVTENHRITDACVTLNGDR